LAINSRRGFQYLSKTNQALPELVEGPFPKPIRRLARPGTPTPSTTCTACCTTADTPEERSPAKRMVFNGQKLYEYGENEEQDDTQPHETTEIRPWERQLGIFLPAYPRLPRKSAANIFCRRFSQINADLKARPDFCVLAKAMRNPPPPGSAEHQLGTINVVFLAQAGIQTCGHYFFRIVGG
jgi:hypothetical protein